MERGEEDTQYNTVRLGMSHSTSLLPGGAARALSSALSVPSLPKLRGDPATVRGAEGNREAALMHLTGGDLQWSARRMETAAAWAHSIRQTVGGGPSRRDPIKATAKARAQRKKRTSGTQASQSSNPSSHSISQDSQPVIDAHFLPDWLKARPEYQAVRPGKSTTPAAQGGTAGHTADSGELLFVKQALHTPSQMRGPNEMALLMRWLRQQRRFAYLRPAQLSTVARSMTLQQSPPGAAVHSGSSAVYFVLEGCVTIRQWASTGAKARKDPPKSTVVVPAGVGFGKYSGWHRLTSRLASALSSNKGGGGATQGGGQGARRSIQNLLLKAKGAAARLRVARLAAQGGTNDASSSGASGSDDDPDPNETPPVVDLPLPLLLAGKRGRAKQVQLEQADTAGNTNVRSHIAHAVVERQRLLGSLKEMVFFDPELCEAIAGTGEAVTGTSDTADRSRSISGDDAEPSSSKRSAGVTAADEGASPVFAPPVGLGARGDTTQVARLGDMEFATAWALQREGAVKGLLSWLACSGVSLLADCSSTRLKSLAGVLEERTYPPGATLFRQGDVARAVVIVKSGHADCTLQTVTCHVQNWPAGVSSWEQVRSTQRHQRVLGKVGPSVVLGHESVVNMAQYSPASRVGQAPQFDAVMRQQGGGSAAGSPLAPAKASPLSPGGGFVSAVFQSMAVGASSVQPPSSPESPPPSPAGMLQSPGSPTPLSSPASSPVSHFETTPGSPAPAASAADRGAQSAQRLARVAQLLAPPPTRPKGISRDVHLPARRAFSLIARDHVTVLVLPAHRVFEVLQSSAALSRLGVAAEALVWAQWLAARRDELYAQEDSIGLAGQRSGRVHTQAGRSDLLSTGTVSKLRSRLQALQGSDKTGQGGVHTTTPPPRILHSALFPEPDEVDLRSGQLLLPLAIQSHTYLGAAARPASAADGMASISSAKSRARSRQSTREDVSATADALMQGTAYCADSPAWPGRPVPSDAAGNRGTGDSIFKSVPSASTAEARRREDAQRKRILGACVGGRYGAVSGLVLPGKAHSTDMPEWSRDVRKLVQQSAAGLVPAIVASPSVVALATLMQTKGEKGGSRDGSPPASHAFDAADSGARQKPANVVATAAAALRGAAAFLAAAREHGTRGRTQTAPENINLQSYAVSHTPTKYRRHLLSTPGQLEAQAQEAAFHHSVAERRAERKHKRQARKWQRTHERGVLMGVLAHAKDVPANVLLGALGAPGGEEGGVFSSPPSNDHGDVFDTAAHAARQQRQEAAFDAADRLIGLHKQQHAPTSWDASQAPGYRVQQQTLQRRATQRSKAASAAAAVRSQVERTKMEGALHALQQLGEGGARGVPPGSIERASRKDWPISQLTQLAAAQQRDKRRDASAGASGGGVSPQQGGPPGATGATAARRRIMAALSRV